MESSLPNRDVVLLGIGHTNAHVLRMWRMNPIPKTRLICLSNWPFATYSGMLPGVLAGQYPPERMTIDLVRLTAACGARLLTDTVSGVDPDRRHVLFEDRPPLPFDVLSIGIGSVPAGLDEVSKNEVVVPIKPMQSFLQRLDSRLRTWKTGASSGVLRIAVVGGGAGGTEVACCLPAAVGRMLDKVELHVTLIDSGPEFLPGLTRGAARRIEQRLMNAGADVLTDVRVAEVVGNMLRFEDGRRLEADVVVWATGAAPPPLLDRIPLPKDERGFLLTRPTLQTTADAPVFVVGDTGTMNHAPTPKAGVYAVRQAPVLWENLRRILLDRPLKSYSPQRGFLKLLNTGDGRAVGEYRGFAFSGEWCWKLKDDIDGRFMDKYQDYEPRQMATKGEADRDGEVEPAMRCTGCGGKLGATVLRRVLSRLNVPSHAQVALGLDQPDDAAIVQAQPSGVMTVTADFFTAPLDDPYLVGRIAALNAASDLFAMGAAPFGAVALVGLPAGRGEQQEQLLYELLAGSLRELQDMQATLIGGHTTESPQLQIGFTMLGNQPDECRNGKIALQPGDQLILTKALGTGCLLAAHMRARCQWDWYAPLLATMLRSNRAAASLRDEFTLRGVTDVTGFGLAGHLLTMLRSQGLAARITLGRLPVLPGALEVMAEGIESTLAPDNREAVADELRDRTSDPTSQSPSRRLLFDPQTSGGLVFGVAAEEVDAVLERLRAGGDGHATVIGEVLPSEEKRAVVEIWD